MNKVERYLDVLGRAHAHPESLGELLADPLTLEEQKSIAIAVIAYRPQEFHRLPKEVQEDAAILTLALAYNTANVAKLHDQNVMDKYPHIVAQILEVKGTHLRFLSDKYAGDPDMVRIAVTQDGDAIQYATPELQNDPDFIKLSLSSKFKPHLSSLPEHLRDDKDVAFGVLQSRPKDFELFNTLMENRNPNWVEQNMGWIIQLIKINPTIFYHFTPAMRDNPDLARVAVHCDEDNLGRVSQRLKDDDEFAAFILRLGDSIYTPKLASLSTRILHMNDEILKGIYNKYGVCL